MANPCYPVAQVVPHQGTMLLLDQILCWDSDQLCALAIIRRTMPMADDQGLPAWVGLELMAQATAAFAGCRAKKEGQSVKIGFLVGSRRYTSSHAYFPIGAQLHINVKELVTSDQGLSVFECKLEASGAHTDISASANINVFRPEDPEQFLQSGQVV